MTSDSIDQFDLTGQVVLITGAGRGLGRGFARGLAAAGASVALVDRSTSGVEETDALIAQEGRKSISLTCDIVDRDSVKATVEAAENRLGPIDILVNNAAIAGPTGLDWELDPAEWWNVMEVNVLGQFNFAQAVLPGMVARGSGRVVNISSGAASKASAGYSGYCISKAALTLWSECLASETAEFGVSVLAFNPGFVRTAMTEYSASQPAEKNPIVQYIRQGFADGADLPIEQVVKQLMYVATGYVDTLSGRQIDVTDDLDELLDRSGELREQNLNVIRIRRLES